MALYSMCLKFPLKTLFWVWLAPGSMRRRRRTTGQPKEKTLCAWEQLEDTIISIEVTSAYFRLYKKL